MMQREREVEINAGCQRILQALPPEGDVLIDQVNNLIMSLQKLKLENVKTCVSSPNQIGNI
jgi:hypothetical protein